MRRAIAAIVLLLSGANDDDYAVHVTAPNDAPTKITINPELRVSVALVGPLPPLAPCGQSPIFRRDARGKFIPAPTATRSVLTRSRLL
jgi:hypothetical protein